MFYTCDERLGWNDKDEFALLVFREEIDRPSELSGKDKCDDQIDVHVLCFQNSHQFFFKAKLLNNSALLLAQLVSLVDDCD